MRLKSQSRVYIRLRTSAPSARLLRSSTVTNMLVMAIWCPSGILSKKYGPPLSKFRYTGGWPSRTYSSGSCTPSLPDWAHPSGKRKYAIVCCVCFKAEVDRTLHFHAKNGDSQCTTTGGSSSIWHIQSCTEHSRDCSTWI